MLTRYQQKFGQLSGSNALKGKAGLLKEQINRLHGTFTPNELRETLGERDYS